MGKAHGTERIHDLAYKLYRRLTFNRVLTVDIECLHAMDWDVPHDWEANLSFSRSFLTIRSYWVLSN